MHHLPQILAEQMMDVTIRVQAIRQFATQQMALLIDNSAVIMHRFLNNSFKTWSGFNCVHFRSKRQSGSEVLYAAAWLVGEFCEQLSLPTDTLGALLRGLTPALPPATQTVYIQAIMKIYTSTGSEAGLETEIVTKLESLVKSADLEVQERASTGLQMMRYVQKQRDKGEADSLEEEMKTFFAGELNPVGPKAQRKVPVPEGLDLDAWINEPEEESEDEDDEDDGDRKVNGNINVFVKDDPDAVRRKVIEPTEEELAANREARMQYQSANPHYLKDTPKASPARSASAASVSELQPPQELDLDVQLHIPGLANTNSYFNLSTSNGEEKKKSKKKKKKGKKNQVPSSEEEEDSGPNVFVSQSLDMPEGATLSDAGSDDNDCDDPHKALSNIVLDDILEEERAKTEKKPKKKKKSDTTDLIGGAVGTDMSKSPELVEHKVHKAKKKKKAKKATKTSAEEDLLGLSLETAVNHEQQSNSGLLLLGQSDHIKLEVNSSDAFIGNNLLQFDVTIQNVGDTKMSQVTLTPTNSPEASTHLTKSIKPGTYNHINARITILLSILQVFRR